MNGASPQQLFWWVGLPYLALGIFVVEHVWRWRYDQFGWTSRSTQLQERRLLKWGSPVFHYGTFAAIAGHVILTSSIAADGRLRRPSLAPAAAGGGRSACPTDL